MPHTTHIRPLTLASLHAACCLAPDDDHLRGRLAWHLHTPYAHVLQALVRQEVVGYACGMALGSTAWVREVYALPTHPTAAPLLVHAMVQWMQEAGAMCQLVVASPAQEPLFAACGFGPQGGLLTYTGGEFLQATHEGVVDLEPQHLMAVQRLHRMATGEDHAPLLREHAFLGSVYLEQDHVRGFALPLLGHGLIVAESATVGLELQRWLLPIQPYLLLPVGHLAAHGHLLARRYRAAHAGTRMVRGTPPPYNPALIYAHP